MKKKATLTKTSLTFLGLDGVFSSPGGSGFSTVPSYPQRFHLRWALRERKWEWELHGRDETIGKNFVFQNF